jgi:hypothetical protein
MNEKQLMNTISATYQRCKDENIGISMNHLRYLCKNSVIPTCKIGAKYLINWQILMDYLNGKYSKPTEESLPKPSVRSIPENKRLSKIRPVI